MTPPGRHWNEDALSESPAVAHLTRLGYTFVPRDTLDRERDSFRDVILTDRLARALRRLNPWLSDENLTRAVRAITHVPSTRLLDASRALHTTLTLGRAFEQDRGDGKRNHDVRYIDFDDPRNNEFLVTRQYSVQGARKTIRPDVALFVNGIPVAIIECKSPTLGEGWKEEATDQFARYQESEERYRELGAPKLFETVQVLVATCGQDAVYGTVLTPHQHFVAWKTVYPKTDAQLAKEFGRAPSPQEVLFEGMLPPANLLDLIQNFVAFEQDEKTGRTVRKLCRYQQYAAVNKAIDRARGATKPTERGGVVWHTQGSGKSLTMLWLALKLRRDPTHENPTLVIVTDRRDLDEQITGTFQACGFRNPEQADSVRELHELLTGPPGKTILTTVQKFQDLDARTTDGRRRREDVFPMLTTASNVFVLADEAHRTQYGTLAGNLRHALPNACFFGFTGTPIDKKDRSTLKEFGPYIDTYTIEQSVKDGATVPIFYESRMPELRIIGRTLDAVFEREFADRSEEEREAIKKKYGTDGAVAAAPRRIEAICLDLIEHYTKFIEPNGFKAQVVAVSREAAVLYKETLERLNAPQSAIVISGSNKDDERLVRHHVSDEERKAVIARFCKTSDGARAAQRDPREAGRRPRVLHVVARAARDADRGPQGAAHRRGGAVEAVRRHPPRPARARADRRGHGHERHVVRDLQPARGAQARGRRTAGGVHGDDRRAEARAGRAARRAARDADGHRGLDAQGRRAARDAAVDQAAARRGEVSGGRSGCDGGGRRRVAQAQATAVIAGLAGAARNCVISRPCENRIRNHALWRRSGRLRAVRRHRSPDADAAAGLRAWRDD